VVGSAALVESVAIERLKKPRLEIVPVAWEPLGPVYPMTFASAKIMNKPLPRPLPSILNQHAAEACEVTITFHTWGNRESRRRVFAPINGRWDNLPEPINYFPVAASSSSGQDQVEVERQAIEHPPVYSGGTGATGSLGTIPVANPLAGRLTSATGSLPPSSAGTASSLGAALPSGPGLYAVSSQSRAAEHLVRSIYKLPELP
jgi:hypothetical protein